MWKAEDSSLIQTFNGHLDRASCIVSHPLSCSNQLSENSANLVSCGADKLVNIWSLSNDKPLFSLKGIFYFIFYFYLFYFLFFIFVIFCYFCYFLLLLLYIYIFFISYFRIFIV